MRKVVTEETLQGGCIELYGTTTLVPLLSSTIDLKACIHSLVVFFFYHNGFFSQQLSFELHVQII